MTDSGSRTLLCHCNLAHGKLDSEYIHMYIRSSHMLAQCPYGAACRADIISRSLNSPCRLTPFPKGSNESSQFFVCALQFDKRSDDRHMFECESSVEPCLSGSDSCGESFSRGQFGGERLTLCRESTFYRPLQTAVVVQWQWKPSCCCCYFQYC